MLRVTRVSGGRAGYYLSDMASEIDAVLLAGPSGADRLGPAETPGPSAGSWIGGGAARYGLTGAVDPAIFTDLLEQRAPSGRPLASAPASVCGYDLTFTCPKSVSVLFAVGDAGAGVPAAVLDAHHEAVRGAMEYVDRRAVTVRHLTAGERAVLATGGALGAAFTHGASRALDPHLHTHVVVANLARGSDGRWSAIDGRGLRAHAPAAGALYDAQLRHELSNRLGVEWTPPGRGHPEIAGFDPVVLADFSRRRGEIRAQLGTWGTTSGRAARLAWAVTRDEKAAPVERAALSAHWHERADRLGLTTGDVAAVLHHRLPAVAGLDEHRFTADLWDSPHAAPRRRDVVRAWSGALPRGAPAGEVERAVDAWIQPGDEPGVAESRQTLRSVVPSGYLLRALGPRPVGAPEQSVWLEGAHAVDRFRRDWGITTTEHALGVDGGPAALAGLPARRLADHLGVQRTLDGVALRLGRSRPERQHEQDRALGRDLG